MVMVFEAVLEPEGGDDTFLHLGVVGAAAQVVAVPPAVMEGRRHVLRGFIRRLIQLRDVRVVDEVRVVVLLQVEVVAHVDELAVVHV